MRVMRSSAERSRRDEIGTKKSRAVVDLGKHRNVMRSASDTAKSGVGVTGLVDEMEERAGDQTGVCLTFERLN